MKELTKEELLRNQDEKVFIINDTRHGVNATKTFCIIRKTKSVELDITTIYHPNFYRNETSVKQIKVVFNGNKEEYTNSEYLSSDKLDVYNFLHLVRLHYYKVFKIFENGVKVDEKNYSSEILPFEYREAKKLKLFKNVNKEDLDKILKEGILPISKTGNDNWENGRRANNSTEVVYLFSPITDKKSFNQYGDVLLEVETLAYRNEIAPNDINNGEYEEYIVLEVKPEEIIGVTYMDNDSI